MADPGLRIEPASAEGPLVLHSCQMSNTLTVRLPRDLAAWLEETSARTGIPRGQIVREALEKARATGKVPGFMRLAGCVRGPRDLSQRKGYFRP